MAAILFRMQQSPYKEMHLKMLCKIVAILSKPQMCYIYSFLMNTKSHTMWKSQKKNK